jgi:hypothetical protein
MPALKKYTYEEAGALLGASEPLSIRTIERMVDAGDLERIGERMRRRISERSIEAYEQGERGIWHANAKKNQRDAANQIPAMLPKRKTGHGSGTSQSNRVDTTSKEDSIPARLPRVGVIRSS